jgi:hypothetical protein
VGWRATYSYKKICGHFQDATAFGFSLEVFQFAVASLNLKYHSGFFSFWVSWGIFGSPVLVRHLRRVFLQARHFCLHEFVICGKLLAPAATRGPHCRASEPPICILIVGHENAPFLSGFSLVVFFSLGIDKWVACNWSIKRADLKTRGRRVPMSK